MLRLYLATAFHLVFLFGYGQIEISGTVKDNVGNLLSGASVSVKKVNSNSILSYAFTDSAGKFSLNFNSDSQNLVLSASYLGFKKAKMNIISETQSIFFILEESTEELKEVVVKSENIEKKGDTLSYSVASFKDQRDRSIADVLKKMPGIKVLPNGQITYLGEPIEKYYIEGMDMLEGRYNLANENISANDVSKVQILENHQPIKVLDSLVFSDRTSLNIKLKNNVSVSGTAEVGAGITPLLFKTNLTPLMFTKKSQSLFSYQYNNTGDDLVRSNNDFSTSGNLIQGFSASKKSILSLQELSKPPLASQRWLDNNEHLVNINHLYRLNNNTDIKINLSYLNGTRVDKGNRNTTYITENDTIVYREEAENILFLNSLNSKLTLEKNVSKSYLRNTFSVESFWDSQRGSLSNGNLDISQELSNPYLILTNDLKIIKPVGKQLITFNSNSGYTLTNQELRITPGQFETILNSGEAYEKNIQNATLSTFFSENTIGFTKKINDFSISPKAGFGYKDQDIKSDLSRVANGDEIQAGTDYLNDLRLRHSNIFITNHLNFKKNRWTIVFKSPIYFRYYNTENKISNQQDVLKRLNFEPDLRISRKLSPYWEASLKTSIENRFGEIDNLYDGYVLRNYLSLISYNSILSEQRSYLTSVNMKYRDPLKAFFVSMAFSFQKSQNNLLFNNRIADNGTLVIESIEQDNNVTTNSVDFNASKRFTKINTTLSLGSRFSFSERPQIVNNVFGSFESVSQAYNFNLESELTKWLSLSGRTNFMFSQLKSTSNQLNNVENWENSLAVFFYISDHEFFNIDAEHYYNNIGTRSNTNYFLNFSYQFTFEKYNLDFKIIWNNALNTRDYISVFNGEFFSNENLYTLRPSQLLFSLKFSL